MKYKYRALTDTGQKVSGTIEAGDMRTAASAIKGKKLTIISLEENKDFVDLSTFKSKFGKVSVGEVTNFTRQLSTMITAGLPLTDALNLLKVQSSPRLSAVLAAILTDVQAGVSLSEAMGKHPEIFSKVYVALVKAGESAGIMDTILNRLADTMENSREFNAKVKGAMVYPMIILFGMIGVMFVMMVTVVPQLKNLYEQFDKQLPIATRLVMGLSDFMVGYWWLILICGVGAFFAIKSYIATAAGRRYWDISLYKLPIAGPLMREIMLTEFTRTVSLLINAGVSIVDALNIVAAALGNSVMESEVKRIAKQIEKGFPVSVSFTESQHFPPIMGQMVAVGEETGKMDQVLEKLSHYYESESEQKVKSLTTAIEPLIIVVLGGAVAFLVFSIILPIYDITNSI